MKITIWTVTINDDSSTPYCEVLSSEKAAFEFVMNYNSVPEDVWPEAWQKHEDGDLAEWLMEQDYVKDGDTYMIQHHGILEETK